MLAIIIKDLRIELRTREMLASLFMLGILILIVESFAFDPLTESGKAAAPGVLWVALIFSGLLGINRSLLREEDSGCLYGLLVAPIDRGTIFLAKVAGNFLILGVAQCVVVPAFVIFFNRPFGATVAALLPVLLPALIGFSAIATLFSAIALKTRAREVLLPVLLLPLASPMFLACVEASRTAMETGSLEGATRWIGMLVAFDVIFLVVGWLGFEYVVVE